MVIIDGLPAENAARLHERPPAAERPAIVGSPDAGVFGFHQRDRKRDGALVVAHTRHAIDPRCSFRARARSFLGHRQGKEGRGQTSGSEGPHPLGWYRCRDQCLPRRLPRLAKGRPCVHRGRRRRPRFRPPRSPDVNRIGKPSNSQARGRVQPRGGRPLS